MSNSNILTRYSCIEEKNPREIVLLRGTGCKWRRCKFCDYHLDFDTNTKRNYEFNLNIMQNITGKYNRLEVLNSGSFSDLDNETMNTIETLCLEKDINLIYFECHWNDRENIDSLKDRFHKLGIEVQIKGGIETFDSQFREAVFCKGIDTESIEELRSYYDQVCLLFGVTGQTEESMSNDIEIGLKYFNRVCVNIMCENTTSIKPDNRVIQVFCEKLLPKYKDNDKIDILLNNTDFGVGNVEVKYE